MICLSFEDCRQSTDDQIIRTVRDVVKKMKPNSLPQIKNISIREQTADALREAILNGELKPGHTLTEMDLSNQLGITDFEFRRIGRDHSLSWNDRQTTDADGY